MENDREKEFNRRCKQDTDDAMFGSMIIIMGWDAPSSLEPGHFPEHKNLPGSESDFERDLKRAWWKATLTNNPYAEYLRVLHQYFGKSVLDLEAELLQVMEDEGIDTISGLIARLKRPAIFLRTQDELPEYARRKGGPNEPT